MAEVKVVAHPRRHCTHHWVLDDPAGGEVLGRCQRCQARKRFPAAPESTQRFDDYREMTAPRGYAERLSA